MATRHISASALPRGVCMLLKYYFNVKVTTSTPKDFTTTGGNFVILGDF